MHRNDKPLQQRHVVVFRQFEHAPIEFELRQLPVEVQLRAGTDSGWREFSRGVSAAVVRQAEELIMLGIH